MTTIFNLQKTARSHDGGVCLGPSVPLLLGVVVLLQVNTQLGEFTLRRHTMETLPQEIEDQADFQAIFGVAEDSSR